MKQRALHYQVIPLVPNTKQACWQKTSFSTDNVTEGVCCEVCFLGDMASTGVPAEICWEPLSCFGQTEATGACGWAPAIPGAGLPGWQSPGEVTPVCQNPPAPARELPPSRAGPYPRLCDLRQGGRKEKSSLEGGGRCCSFSPQSAFPILDASSNIRNDRHTSGL